jgi:6-phosphogluconolactonase
MKRVTIDERRQVLVAKTDEEAYDFCAQTFIEEAAKSIAARASFSVALSGGQTPIPMYEKLAEPSSALLVNWPLVEIFWSDERTVPPTDSESNYGNAIEFLNTPPLNQAKKHRLVGDCDDLITSAANYENLVKAVCAQSRLDMVLLGVGDDGHTASLFPNTEALKDTTRLFTPNFVPQKNMWRMTITFTAIEQARAVYVLVLGRGKSKILKQIFFGDYTPDILPAQRLGTPTNPVTFIVDRKAVYGLGLLK